MDKNEEGLDFMNSKGKLTVILPAYNESKGVLPTLDALRAQKDRDFDVVFVNNNSTDDTWQVIDEYIFKHALTRWKLIDEAQKGTGAAADTGMRYAIEHGAVYIARTDTDCIPREDWIQKIKAEFETGTLFIAGRITPRRDEFDIPVWKYNALDAAVVIATVFGKIRKENKGPEYKGPYIMSAGCNVAITADLYKECGGFPRTKIEDVHEDRALVNNVRKVTDKYKSCKDILVYSSSRRVQEWGLWNTLMWYKDHSFRPEVVDIR
jgi:glycosyltransferase involved in cell wall biosynthesis